MGAGKCQRGVAAAIGAGLGRRMRIGGRGGGVLLLVGWMLLPLPAIGDGATPSARTTRDGVVLGSRLFLTECAGCHGLKGDGKGLADAAMEPHPRDLTSGKYKLRTTSMRAPVSNAELLAILTNGIPGTAMPSFRFLGEEERRHLVEYVASLASLPAEDPAAAIDVPAEPAPTTERLARGKQLFTDLGCVACHGPAGRGDGAAAPYLKDEWGSKTPPRNLIAEPFKGGDGARDIYLRLAVGMPGTPMPSYAEAASPDEIWSLALYVKSLRQPAPARPTDEIALGERLVAEKHCLACHSLPAPGGEAADAAKRVGGTVGPPLDLELRLLRPEWIEAFLQHPRDHGKIYPAYPYRMPDLQLSAADADAIVAYLAKRVGVSVPLAPAAPPQIDAAQAARGRELFASSCASCHHFDAGGATAPLEQQGPDLAHAAERYDYELFQRYVDDPRSYDAHAIMGKTTLSPSEVQAIAQYLWSPREGAGNYGSAAVIGEGATR